MRIRGVVDGAAINRVNLEIEGVKELLVAYTYTPVVAAAIGNGGAIQESIKAALAATSAMIDILNMANEKKNGE